MVLDTPDCVHTSVCVCKLWCVTAAMCLIGPCLLFIRM